MKSADRRRLVVDLLREDGQVAVADLAAATGASEMTVRRDLDQLAARGILRRVHGGAVPAAPSGVEPPFDTRLTESAPAKRAIAAAAAGLVRDGETVVLDSGTTALEVARRLRGRPVTVLPLSLHAARELADDPEIRLLLPGGEPRPGEQALVGPLTLASLRALRFDVALLSPCAFSLEAGLTAFDLDDAEVKRQALAVSARSVVLADSAKWGKAALAHVCAADRPDVLVTDPGASAEGGAGRTWCGRASGGHWGGGMTVVPRAARVATWVFFALNGFAVGMWLVHIPTVERATGISHSTLGVLLLVLGGSAFVGMQVSGPLTDRFGHRRIVPAAGVLVGLAVAGPGFAGSWWALGIALAVFGFANGSLDVSMNAHAVVVERAYPRPIMAAFHAMWSIGGAIAAVVGAAVLGAGVPTAVSLSACGVFCVVVSLAAARFLIEADQKESTSDDAGAPRRSAPPKRLVWLLGGVACALMLAEGVANDWAALHLEYVLGTSASTAAFAYGAFAVAMTTGRFLTDRVAALVGPAAIVRYGAALAAIGLTTASLSPWVPLALVGWALFGLGLSGGVPQLFTAAGNLDTRASGALMAKVVGLGYVGLLAGPALIGGLTRWMPLNVAFAVPVVLCVLAVAFAGVLAPKPAEEPCLTAG